MDDDNIETECMNRLTNYTLRAMVQQDFNFYQDLHKNSLKPYVEQIWGWIDSQQEKRLKECFNPLKMQVIQVCDQDVGVLEIEKTSEGVFLKNILILPEFQGRGLGSQIIKDVVEDAIPLSVFLSVLRPNPAKKLYERLGFKVVSEDPERFYMKRESESV